MVFWGWRAYAKQGRDRSGLRNSDEEKEKVDARGASTLYIEGECAPNHDNVQFSTQLQLLAQLHMHLIFGPQEGGGKWRRVGWGDENMGQIVRGKTTQGPRAGEREKSEAGEPAGVQNAGGCLLQLGLCITDLSGACVHTVTVPV